MNQAIFVDHLCYALGDETCSVEEAAARGRLLSSPEALREAGFCTHHVCRPDTSPYDLARRAVQNISGALANIDAIIYATSLPLNGNIGSARKYEETRDVKHLMDFPASHLQADFNLDGAMVIGINQLACTSLLGAIRLARTLIAAEPEHDRILCLTSDRFPEGALYEQAYNLISDGAAGCIVSTTPSGFRLLGGHAITNGAMAFASDDETIGSYFTYSYRLIQECLTKLGLSIDEIHWFVSQNINIVTWQVLSSLLGIDRARVLYPTMSEVGHVISGDNIINMSRLVEDDRFTTGDKILLSMAGYGLNWQCIVLEKA
jgi:3-oxoacyl-[acyl-carrier-protein] synthase-3